MKYLLSLSMVLLLCGCGSNRQIEQELSTATRLLRIEPDSSLRIIENIDPDRILRRSTRAKYALLYSAALDKNYVDADDDSLIRIAYRYYDNRICSDSVKFLINYHYGRIYQNGDDYQEAMRWLAAKENVPLSDLHEMTRTLYEALGTETSKRAFVHYPAGTYTGQTKAFEDTTHFNPYGAYQIAQCVIEGMKKAVPNLAKHLKIDPAYNPAYPDNPDTFHWNNSPFTEIEKPDGN